MFHFGILRFNRALIGGTYLQKSQKNQKNKHIHARKKVSRPTAHRGIDTVKPLHTEV
jgi:hypothetical protein